VQSAVVMAESWTYDQYLLRLCELELQQREARKRRKMLAASRLPVRQTLTDNLGPMPPADKSIPTSERTARPDLRGSSSFPSSLSFD
jgi:hypothetical protein